MRIVGTIIFAAAAAAVIFGAVALHSAEAAKVVLVHGLLGFGPTEMFGMSAVPMPLLLLVVPLADETDRMTDVQTTGGGRESVVQIFAE